MDGDRFHGLSGLYQKPYQQMCEAKFDLKICIWITMGAFLKDLKKKGAALTLLKVSDLISELIGEEFQVKNPFLFWTKAEMCKVLAKNGQYDLPTLTMSCDSPHRQKPVQCGYCSSCLLRRQSLAASIIKDRTRYVVLHGERPVKHPSLYFLNMQAQVRTLDSLFAISDNPWKSITKKFPVLDDIVDQTAIVENLLPIEMQNRLIQLYRNYVSEWNAVESLISKGLLNQYSDLQISSKYTVLSQPQ
ncbi:7-cyano-7-deazaguanine synthase [Anabaena sp. FACHB-1237]|uniref:7-cyano-7-deazaguanine synthase n=1 Tax=Anabaena sp. FACHB-1237 TaxID=2692769 RepID=UPI001F54F2DD|nr:7-cyano-7-deazaguanine synthase [Anabaena sp. FACHB-1237]